MASSGTGGRGERGHKLVGAEFLFYKMKSSAGDGGGDCTTLGMYLMPLNLSFHFNLCFTKKKKKF